MGWRKSMEATWALVRRAANELLRGVLAPTIFFLGLTSVFGALDNLAGFPAPYKDWLIPVSLLQGAGFTGAATGVNLARDIEQGWFDRLLVSPAPRPVILAGLVLSAALRSLIPAIFLLIVGFAIGVQWPGLDGLLIALLVVMGMGTVAACWGTTLALKYRSQSAAPLMQAGMLLLVLTTTAYAPLALLTGWLHTVARYNPVTQVVEAARQGFIGSVTWGNTWPGLVALAGLLAVLSALALRGMHRTAI
ncbi:MAG: ABC transporter permease [Actinobacteria bacterium]|nr:MAG: ABC transporter permease [Actinomycetota bacterium]